MGFKAFSFIFALLFLLNGFSFPQQKNFSISVSGNSFNGNYFVQNNNVYVELVPFLQLLNVSSVTFFTKDLKETKDKRVYVSLQGAASSMQGRLAMDWENGIASFYPNAAFMRNSQQPIVINSTQSSSGKLNIYVQDQPFYAPYFVQNQDVYVELVPFAQALNVLQVSFFPKDIEEMADGSTFVNLRGAEMSLGGETIIDWETNIADFTLLKNPISGTPQITQPNAYPQNNQPYSNGQTINNFYYNSWPYYSPYSCYWETYCPGYYSYFNYPFFSPFFYPFTPFVILAQPAITQSPLPPSTRTIPPPANVSPLPPGSIHIVRPPITRVPLAELPGENTKLSIPSANARREPISPGAISRPPASHSREAAIPAPVNRTPVERNWTRQAAPVRPAPSQVGGYRGNGSGEHRGK